MEPGETTGLEIGFGTSIGVVLLGIAGFMLYRNQNSMPDGLNVGSVPTAIVQFVVNVFPFALLTYGIAGDVITQQFKLSIPSIAAIASILVVGVVSKLIASNSGVSLAPQDTTGRIWCTIPGLEEFESPYIPTAILSTVIISMYYMCWAWHVNIPSGNLALAFGLVLITQYMSFVIGDCSGSYRPIVGNAVIANVAITVLLGLIIGVISWASAQTNPSYNPFIMAGSTHTIVPQYNLKKCPDGSEPTNGKCPYGKNKPGHTDAVQSGGDENTFVAELYKNGQLVTDSIAS